jgi:methionine biosynthesis protein MetW
MQQQSPRIGILVVAYNAASTLAKVLDRIPNSFRPRIDEIFVCDDYSQDATYLVGLGYKQLSELPLTIIRHPKNLGYGGNQKAGYRLAIEHALDIIVLLHGDGQYAPECIESLVDPLVRGEADAVFGSRMMVPGDARKGGMPRYKYVGNRILTAFQNGALGTHLSEFHSGYRAYSVPALASIPFERNSDGFNFDTQIILQLLDAGRGIVEVPIPTYYGDEICYVNGMKYAKDVTADVLRYRLNKMGFGTGSTVRTTTEYQLKESDESSHGHIAAWMSGFPPSHVLDLGCSGGRLGERLRKQGHEVTGVEIESIPGTAQRLDRLVIADLEKGLPPEVATGYDVVVAGDVLEHVRFPERLLEEMRRVVRSGGSAVVSVPNFGHWYARGRVALGLFDYDTRGILDRGHLRFFTRRSFRRLAERSGWSVSRTEYVGLPMDVLASSSAKFGSRVVQRIDSLLVRLRPTLFAYQFIFQLRPTAVAATEEIRLDEAPSVAAAG